MTFLRIILGLAAMIAATTGQASANENDPCAGRDRCRVLKIHDAGTDAADNRLSVVETLVLDPPGMPEHARCGRPDGQPGGREFWLLTAREDGRGGLGPRPVLTVCDGAAGNVETKVLILPNRLYHTRIDDARDLWRTDRIFELSPSRLVGWRYCSYAPSETGGVAQFGTIRPLEIRFRSLSGHGTCRHAPPPYATFSPTSLDLPVATLSGEIPEGTVIGDCATAVSAANGFTPLGSPGQAMYRVILFDEGSLLVEVHDPDPFEGVADSPTHDEHLEFWRFAEDGGLNQIGIGLRDGAVWTGYGKPHLPSVRRWTARNLQGQTVTVLHLRWPSPETLFSETNEPGMSLAYAETKDGRIRQRMTATSSIRHADRDSLGGTARTPLVCAAEDGVLKIVKEIPPEGDTQPLP